MIGRGKRGKQGIDVVINLSWRMAFSFFITLREIEHRSEFIFKTFGRKSLLFCVFPSLQLSTVPWRMVIIHET